MSWCWILLSLLQGAQYSSEAVSRLPGRFSRPVSVGEWRAPPTDHKSGPQFLLWPVSTQSMDIWHFAPDFGLKFEKDFDFLNKKKKSHSLSALSSSLLPSPSRLHPSTSPHLRVVFGNSNGLAVVDYVQKTVVLNLGTVELYGSNDPYQRQPRSPRKTRQPSGGNEGSEKEKVQVFYVFIYSLKW